MVIIGGHIDSWDVGQGAMDDGGGLFIAWRALSVIQKLGLRPKRNDQICALFWRRIWVFGRKKVFRGKVLGINVFVIK